MGFLLDGLDTESYDRKYSDKELVKRIMAYFRPYKKAMIFTALCLLLNSIASSAGPILISNAIDLVSANPVMEWVSLFSLAVVLLGATAWVFNYFRQRISTEIIGSIVLKLRANVFEKTIAHDLSFYDEHPSGKIVSRITSDTQDFSQIVVLVIDFLSQFIMVFLLGLWLFTISVRLALILIAMAPVAVIIALSFRKIARKVTSDGKKMNAKINAHIQESISGIMVAKTFRKEKVLYKKFSADNKQAFAVGLKRGITLNLIFPLISIFAGIGTGAIAYSGGFLVKDGALSAGDWYLFMQAVSFFWWPLLNVASFWSQFQDGLAAAERVFALIDKDPAVIQENDSPIADIDGRIEFKNLGFSYTEKEKILENFSLTIHSGETIALVGHTGAGKSSIARLITRFYEFQAGSLLIDGRDIRSFNLGEYRRHIGLVPQTPYLFSGTVADNIRYSSPQASDEQIIKAASSVGRGDWVNDLPEGLDTDVGQRGARLSMGQRQLIALARILLKNPSIFILDEATASIDPFTEVQIQEGLDSVMRSRTAIVVAHRLSTVKTANRILVMKNGNIIEEGSHESLMENGGHYAELYNTYFRHQSMEYVESMRSI